ncbi:hypothetical protein RRG08_007360 [Elysia crispata]|uniref:Uncharacterized protein n=1 Tax=Elysia crispata TaxID=231223 RepID=A0AAE1AT59_9GAST|nr:hypothetical protein RRG08_007360 [Elysia crispata]
MTQYKTFVRRRPPPNQMVGDFRILLCQSLKEEKKYTKAYNNPVIPVVQISYLGQVGHCLLFPVQVTRREHQFRDLAGEVTSPMDDTIYIPMHTDIGGGEREVAVKGVKEEN